MRHLRKGLLAALLLLAGACSSPADPGAGDTSSADALDAVYVATDAFDVDASDGATDAVDVGAGDVGSDVYSPDEPLDILFVGNSFTFGGPVPVVVEHLAIDAGWPAPNVEWSAFGGESLQGHRGRDETLDKIDAGGWEVVVLQELSTRPTDNRGDPARFKMDATWLHDRIKASSPHARVILYETWARHPDHGIYPVGFDDPEQMQSQLREHYYDCAERYIPENAIEPVQPAVEVAPVGDAWEAHLAEQDPLRLHADDDYHAGPRGQYLNGLVIYGTIYRRATAGRSSWEVGADHAARLQQSADHTTGYVQTGGPVGAGSERGLDVGQRVGFDFGGELTQAAGWNALDDSIGGSLTNAADAQGEATTLDISVTDGFTGTNEQGPSTNEAGYPPLVGSDTFWTGLFDGHDAALSALGQLSIRGLDPEQTYTLRVFAGRTGDDSGRGRLTRYEVGEVTRDLDAADNTSEVAVFTDVSPNTLGEVAIDVTVSPAGSSRFAYIGALEVVGQ